MADPGHEPKSTKQRVGSTSSISDLQSRQSRSSTRQNTRDKGKKSSATSEGPLSTSQRVNNVGSRKEVKLEKIPSKHHEGGAHVRKQSSTSNHDSPSKLGMRDGSAATVARGGGTVSRSPVNIQEHKETTPLNVHKKNVAPAYSAPGKLDSSTTLISKMSESGGSSLSSTLGGGGAFSTSTSNMVKSFSTSHMADKQSKRDSKKDGSGFKLMNEKKKWKSAAKRCLENSELWAAIEADKHKRLKKAARRKVLLMCGIPLLMIFILLTPAIILIVIYLNNQ